MIVEESFYRPAEVARETRALPAGLYNLAQLLLARAPDGCLFVPIRSMQYLAVLDREEFIFVDREGGRRIELAWQAFRRTDRAALDTPVAYDAVYYSGRGAEAMRRLQGDFHRALVELRRREPAPAAARIIPLPRDGD